MVTADDLEGMVDYAIMTIEREKRERGTISVPVHLMRCELLLYQLMKFFSGRDLSKKQRARIESKLGSALQVLRGVEGGFYKNN